VFRGSNSSNSKGKSSSSNRNACRDSNSNGNKSSSSKAKIMDTVPKYRVFGSYSECIKLCFLTEGTLLGVRIYPACVRCSSRRHRPYHPPYCRRLFFFFFPYTDSIAADYCFFSAGSMTRAAAVAVSIADECHPAGLAHSATMEWNGSKTSITAKQVQFACFDALRFTIRSSPWHGIYNRCVPTLLCRLSALHEKTTKARQFLFFCPLL